MSGQRIPTALLPRLRAALSRRARGPYRALGRIDRRLDFAEHSRTTQLDSLEGQLSELTMLVEGQAAALAELRAMVLDDHVLLHDEFRGVLRALASDESENRRRLHQLRDDPDYSAAWTDPDPLVSVTVVTRDRADLLTGRALPSILGQTHQTLEVIVVGDHADEATADAVAAIGDPRVSYHNLPHRLDLGPDPVRRWMVAATLGRNEATRRARGRWLVCFDDDDALHPHAVARLLELARAERSEVAYGQARAHTADGTEILVGSFPPVLTQFTFASAIYHAGLRCFERELVAAQLGTPSDWFTAERMLRAGVRFARTDEVTCDIYPAGPARRH